MPTVGDRTFGYEPRDIAAAEQYAAETGMDITYEEEGEENFIREILELAFEKKHLTYLENKYLFTLEVLENERYFNDNIEGRYFKKDFIKDLDT